MSAGSFLQNKSADAMLKFHSDNHKTNLKGTFDSQKTVASPLKEWDKAVQYRLIN